MFFKPKVSDERIIITAKIEFAITKDIFKFSPMQVKRAIEADINKRIKGIGTVTVTEIEGLQSKKNTFAN